MLLLWTERTAEPPRCRQCGYPYIYKQGMCDKCFDAMVEAKIDEIKESKE